MEASSVRAVLFAKDKDKVAAFYSEALGMTRGAGDESHSVLERRGFELIVHEIPRRIADGMEIDQPPVRRVSGAVRLDYPVESIDHSRKRPGVAVWEFFRSPAGWRGGGPELQIPFGSSGRCTSASWRYGR